MVSKCAVYDISLDFYTIRLGVDVSKLHVRSCVHHLKCFSEMNFTESSD